ncbi:MAG: NYN domain-containing protein [Myxococcales bacterium]|nr:NYN domain-containing protein [Myxococcales bacterium]
MAVFCDYENVAIGSRESRFDEFDIELVLERLLDKGKIVVKKAYCDWDRYKSAKRPMHEAAFELIEIPHVSYSGKNSADIRMVVDALDLCYTKEHVDTFVIISGDSDFSPLVSKLRENDKTVIGVGVKKSSSDLLVDNCDEFIYYDDLVREHRQAKHALKRPAAKAAPREGGKDDAKPQKGTREDALELVLDTVEALFKDREGHLFGSMVKQVIKRKRPHFEESYYGYRTFSELLEDARARGLLEVARDEKSGGYIITDFGPKS